MIITIIIIMPKYRVYARLLPPGIAISTDRARSNLRLLPGYVAERCRSILGPSSRLLHGGEGVATVLADLTERGTWFALLAAFLTERLLDAC